MDTTPLSSVSSAKRLCITGTRFSVDPRHYDQCNFCHSASRQIMRAVNVLFLLVVNYLFKCELFLLYFSFLRIVVFLDCRFIRCWDVDFAGGVVLVVGVISGSRAFKCATRELLWRCCWQSSLRSDGPSSQIFDFTGLITALEGRRW